MSIRAQKGENSCVIENINLLAHLKKVRIQNLAILSVGDLEPTLVALHAFFQLGGGCKEGKEGAIGSCLPPKPPQTP
ncbi:hypothetical protein [Nostoc sp. UHCC 0302]|uniref:hypothetical protein n=1 Tax=Nostoc sp. UHCC 0302 TaxID=3134896 RepID=UPI00311CA67F